LNAMKRASSVAIWRCCVGGEQVRAETLPA
jgi:hypothetical protein